jgi:hypothetical protein
MENFISRRQHERMPREGYAQTLQFSLIPAAKVNVIFWCVMACISVLIAYIVKDNTVGYCLHGTLTVVSLALVVKYNIELKRLKMTLNNILKTHPEFKI